MTLPSVLEPEALISWDGDGTFTGAHDDVTRDVAADPGITLDLGRDGARSLDPPKAGTADLELRNQRGTYSQERPDSPVYQRVLPGRQGAFAARHGVRRTYRSHAPYRAHLPYRGRARYGLFQGYLDDLAQQTETGRQRVRLSLLDPAARLVGEGGTISVPVTQNPRVDQCFHLVLDAFGWPADKREIAISDTTLLWFWVDERPAWTVFNELLAAEGPGSFYVWDGVFCFENRNYRTTAPRATTARATLFDRVAGQRTPYRAHVPYRAHRLYRGRTSGLYFTALGYDTGFRNIYNRATYPTRRRTLGSLGQVWEYGAAFSLGAGQSRTLIAKPSDPFLNAVTPTSPTDYTVSGGTVSVSLSADSGLVAFITVTATSGTPTVSDLRLRAQPLTVVSETTVQNTVDAGRSIAKFSPIPGANIPRTLQVQGWPEIDPAAAEAVCNAWVTRYMVQRPAVTVQLRNADAEHLRLLLEARPSDRLTLVEANTGLAADVWVNSKQLRISGAGGRTVEAVLGCEKVEEVGGSVWDGASSLWDAAVWGN